MPTIGVAVSIPEPWATQLQDYRRDLGDPEAGMIPTHITIVPPTAIASLDDLEAHLQQAATATEDFCVHLRGTGTFRPVSPVVFVTLAEGISQCELLARAVRQGPLDVDLDFPYHPHVTVAHHLNDTLLDRAFEDLAGFDAEFDVTEFHLYVHEDQVGWRPARTYSLLADPGEH